MTNGPLSGMPATPDATAQVDAGLEHKTNSLSRKLAAAGGDEAALKKACQDFESIFISKLWQQMRSTVPKEGYLHSRQEEAYVSMFDQEFAVKMSQAGGIGLGDMLFNQLKATLARSTQDTATPAAPQDMAALRTAPASASDAGVRSAQTVASPDAQREELYRRIDSLAAEIVREAEGRRATSTGAADELAGRRPGALDSEV